MAYKSQLIDLKRSTVSTVAGVCVDSPQFVARANEVQRRLLRRGDWFDTEWLVKLCVFGRCVTWPRYVGTIKGARACDGDVGEIKNKWYSIVGGASSLGRSYGGGNLEYGGYGWFGNDLVFEDRNTVPTYNQVSGNTGRLIRYYAKYQADIGKTITIYGKKFGGEPLMHLDATDNLWKPGLILTAAAPFATSPVLVTRIDSVIREATQGECRLYEYNPDTDLLRDLAYYEPNETNPRYRSSVISDWCNLAGCLDVTTVDGVDYHRKKSVIEVICKLEHHELVNDYDFLLIDNFDAFKLGFQAVKLEEMNDDNGAEIKWLKAVKELNLQLRDKNPDSQINVAVNVVNGCAIHSPY